MSGCGLISSDITTVKFDLPPRSYNFDTSSLMLPSGSVPPIPCTAATECCDAALLLGYDCSTQTPLDCVSGLCSLSKTIETPPQTIDLKMEVPALSSFSNQSVVDVSISQITYDATSTMNIDLPPVELFLAPEGVTATADPMAKKFGTVPIIPAGTTVTGGMVKLENNGAALTGFAHNFGTPFSFLSRTTVTITGGSPVPAGAVSITVRGRLAAKPGL